MKKAIVIYTSKRGSTKQYAEWIAEDLDCGAKSLAECRGLDLHGFDLIIYGGWIRGSGIVDFDKFAKMIDDELMERLIVFGVGFADETAENYAQVWGYSLGKIDPKNDRRVLLYILGGRYDPSSGANVMKERIDGGCDFVKRENIASLVRDARRKLGRQQTE